jgi:putative transposase
MKRTRHTAE